MVVPPGFAKTVQDLVHTRIRQSGNVIAIAPIDHAIYGETVFRATFDRAIGDLGSTVIVKCQRAAGSGRSEINHVHNEIAALQFLGNRGLICAPRLIAADDVAGLIVMEDLGTGPSLEDALFANDPEAATDALVAFGTALGAMHAGTAGFDGEYYQQRNVLGPINTAADRMLLPPSVTGHWHMLREIVADRPELPQPPSAIESEIAEIARMLSDPGPWLVLSNGDACPANTRLAGKHLRFLDFEGAGYRHALLDLVSLHLPFPACPCWSRLPATVAAVAILAYREAFSQQYPPVLDDDCYYSQLAGACMLWTIQRLTRLPKLDAFDEPHPVGFSRRGQVIVTIESTVEVVSLAENLPHLAAWFTTLGEALEERWSSAPMNRPVFPAFEAGCGTPHH